jgi:hypothetical protein
MRNRILIAAAALLALAVAPVMAGEWHTSNTNVCTDCHTMHFSMQHGFSGGTVSTTPTNDGNWLGTDLQGPNGYLLKMPANELCLACHDGQTFAPDVLGLNTNASPAQGRSAGALNTVGGVDGYTEWMGHTLDSTDDPPGYNPAFGSYDTLAGELECVNCHRQHGSPGVYRNLMPRNFSVTYTIATTRNPALDVWINYDYSLYTANSGNAATFNPIYANANVLYNRRAPMTNAGASVLNNMERHCATCHGDFHGTGGETFAEGPNTYGQGPGGVGGVASGTPGAWEDFIRHPSGQQMGLMTGGHSNMTRYTGATARVKTYSSLDTLTDAVPGCLSCHKAHGNLNPFGLVFLNRAATAASITEEGADIATPPAPAPGEPAYARGYRNLCGQCHGQGN